MREEWGTRFVGRYSENQRFGRARKCSGELLRALEPGTGVQGSLRQAQGRLFSRAKSALLQDDKAENGMTKNDSIEMV
jgi:hypothetical protein